jgi:cytochrome subunit of sulfide dehydrogenase
MRAYRDGVKIPILVFVLFAGSTIAAPITPDTRTMASTCAACHGTNGQSGGGIPTLAGLPKSYFIKQMQDFKSGARAATVMNRHAKGYSDAQIEQLAEYFAAQKRSQPQP